MKKYIEIKSEFSHQFEILEFTCGVCRDYTAVLGADNSNGEYRSIYICKICLDKAFKQFEPILEKWRK